MQFTTALVSILATAVIAIPTGNTGGGSAPYVACPGTYSPQCCATDILGLAVLNCASPPTVPTSANNFKNICSATAGGQQARCCLLPVLGQALLCDTPAGV
ncbi:hypothetical protein CLIM01_05849 [Colletotrichum limetticola]|uniref:Fungal hydrophobin n=1 Tax=Colletotrichum limetticola TaxID=1209924 RepID=A0ABQ9PZ24_9PEZI|nr:hypothetical protein CLIM01_05849 [Colletotrichum limetticola]